MIFDVAVVGGGIVGLATLRELTVRFPHLRVACIEKEQALSRHQSGHNSGVIHSGIYYAPGSLKARLCVEGRRAVWRYCEAKGIEFRNVGKLIVATHEEELGRLDALWERGQRNGVERLELLDAAGIRRHEPHCAGIKAISSPVTGIVDWTRVAQSFADDALSAGATVFTGRQVRGIERRSGVTLLRANEGDVQARAAIVCGGLYADRLAKLSGGADEPKIVPFRGDYLVLRAERAGLVRGNIYPVPDPRFPFLGVHFTPRIDGAVWLGPNAVPALAREGYARWSLDVRDAGELATYPGFLRLARRHWRVGLGELYRDNVRSAYVAALQRYVPELTATDCLPGPSGVRAQAMRASGELVDDFVFEGSEGVLHVRNAPSPGATSSLAIAAEIVSDAAQRFDLGRPPVPVSERP